MAKELVPIDSKFMISAESDIAEIMSEELEGMGPIPYDRIKIPAAGSTAFEIPTDDPDKPEHADAIVGIVVYNHAYNAYWKDAYSGEVVTPDCCSVDAKTGKRSDGSMRECDSCPYNVFGSEAGGKGKACKNMRRLYILQDGEVMPIILTLPPTSLKAWKDYVSKAIVMRKMRLRHVITRITLKKEQNSNGMAYSSAVFSLVSRIDPKEYTNIDKYAAELKASVQELDTSPAEQPPIAEEYYDAHSNARDLDTLPEKHMTYEEREANHPQNDNGPQWNENSISSDEGWEDITPPAEADF